MYYDLLKILKIVLFIFSYLIVYLFFNLQTNVVGFELYLLNNIATAFLVTTKQDTQLNLNIESDSELDSDYDLSLNTSQLDPSEVYSQVKNKKVKDTSKFNLCPVSTG